MMKLIYNLTMHRSKRYRIKNAKCLFRLYLINISHPFRKQKRAVKSRTFPHIQLLSTFKYFLLFGQLQEERYPFAGFIIENISIFYAIDFALQFSGNYKRHWLLQQKSSLNRIYKNGTLFATLRKAA